MVTCRAVVVAVMALGTACSDPEPANGSPDVADTGEVDAGADTEPDAAEPDAADVEDDVDTGPNPLTGTPLEGVVVTWTEPLHLCSGWNEGYPIEEELAAKVEIVLPPQPRFGLSPAQMGKARLRGWRVHRGPMAAERFEGDAVSSEVVDWNMPSWVSSPSVFASIEHDLGPAGVLIEQYGVGRDEGEPPAPVEVTYDNWEIQFVHHRPGANTVTRLERCKDQPDREEAVSVLVGASGERMATLTSYWRTQASEIVAGSYPVNLDATRLALSDEPWMHYDARGFWAHTYAAQHHNWDDSTVVDYTRDLGLWHSVFRPIAEGLSPVSYAPVMRVALSGVSGFDVPASFAVTRMADDGEPGEPEVFDIVAEGKKGWRRVDANHLERQLAFECEGGTALAVGWDEVVLQLLECPKGGAPGERELVGVVPVAFRHDMARVGSRFGPEGLAPKTFPSGKPGWHVEVGEGSVDLEATGAGAFIVTVHDAAGEEVSSFWAEPAPLAYPLPADQTTVAESADGEVRVTMVRQWAGQGVGESSIFAPVSLEVAWGSERRLVEAWDRLRYTNSHHNWNDSLVATTGDGLEITWRITYGLDGLVETVRVHDAAGADVLPETVVEAVD